MKTIFIPAEMNFEISDKRIKELSKKLPKNIAIAYSIQFRKIAQKIKEKIQKKQNITRFIQVLGCSKPIFPKETQAILLVSSGRFHAVSLAFETNLPVYLFERDGWDKISNEEIEKLKIKQKSQYLKFLNADKIGILISTKPGQENFKRALKLKKSLKNKDAYLFIGNNFNLSEFQNFKIDSWINTACPRLDMDFPVINISKLDKK